MTRFIPPLRRHHAAVSADVDAEIQSHLDERIRLLVHQGMDAEAARAEALRRFGDVDATRRSMRSSAHRHAGRRRRRDRVWALVRDARYTMRQLRRSPGVTAVVVITLGLGIGASATMFGVVDRLLLRPPAALHNPGELRRVYVSHLDGPNAAIDQSEVSYLRFTELRAAARGVADLAAMGEVPVVAGSGEGARRVKGAFVSANFWPLLGARPVLGRFFSDTEDQPPDGTPVVVLGYAYWQAALGGDSSVIGRRMDLGAGHFTVIGVAQPDFHGVNPGRVDVWMPATTVRVRETHLQPGWYATHNFWWLEMVARLRPGATPAQVEAALTPAFARSFIAAGVDTARARERARVSIAPLLQERGPQRKETTRVAIWLAVVAGTVLLLACANVANLLLARAIQRRREIAVRVALGVGRARLLAQLLVESLLLSIMGAAVGVALAFGGGRLLHAILLPDVARDERIFDGRVLLFGAGMALLAGVLSGLAPALHAIRRDVIGMLKGWAGDGGQPRPRLRTLLLIGQAALSTTLLLGAGLFSRSLRNARATDLGFDARHLLIVRAEMRDATPPAGGESAVYRQFVDRLRTIPGVAHAATTMQIPFSVSGSTHLDVPGVDSAALDRMGEFLQNPVGPDYFETMGTRMWRGRALSTADRAGSPLVLVVSVAMARALWPTDEALGKCVRVGGRKQPCALVVGVAENVHQYEVRAEPMLQYWFPESQNQGGSSGAFAAVARVTGDVKAMVPAIRNVLQPVAPRGTYLAISAVGDSVDRAIRPWWLGAMVLGVFGLLGLCIAAMGLYSVLAYTVSQRTAELGLRMALGARSANVLLVVVGEGLRVTMVGVALGLVVSLGVARFVATLLFGVRATDPMVVLVVVVTLVAAAFAASVLPAWRASRVDPAVSLRSGL